MLKREGPEMEMEMDPGRRGVRARGNPSASREPSETEMAGEQQWQFARPWVAIMSDGMSLGSSRQGLTSRLAMKTKPNAGTKSRKRKTRGS